jgi:hypothetical protein
MYMYITLLFLFGRLFFHTPSYSTANLPLAIASWGGGHALKGGGGCYSVNTVEPIFLSQSLPAGTHLLPRYKPIYRLNCTKSEKEIKKKNSSALIAHRVTKGILYM